jgi:hypothetical protein
VYRLVEEGGPAARILLLTCEDVRPLAVDENLLTEIRGRWRLG